MPLFIHVGPVRVNADHIVSVEPRLGDPSGFHHIVALTDGRTLSAVEDPSDRAGVIVPAPPGLVMVEAFHPEASAADRTVEFYATTVIAFRVTGRDAPAPIGLDGEPSPENAVVVQPDGQCVGQSRTWASLDAFKAVQQAKADQEAGSVCVSFPPRGDRSPPAASMAPKRQEECASPVGLLGLRAAHQLRLVPAPAEQLRDTILAEPIEPVRPDAPWRPGRDLAEVIAEVRDAHPDLHEAGVGYSPRWGWKWGPGDQDRAREGMTTPDRVAEFERALRFLSHAGRRFHQARVNGKRTTYAWKHVAERVMGEYVSNGMLVTAAYALGFKVATDDSPNPCINLGDKAATLDTHRGR